MQTLSILEPLNHFFSFCLDLLVAFYSKVTPAGVVEGVKSLTGAGVPPQTIILDDGWQQVTPAPPSNDEEETNNTNQQLSSSAAATAEQSSVSDTLFGAFASGVATFYDRFVRTAPHGSCSNRIWRALAHTVLRPGLWKFYDSSTDFNRQLAGFERAAALSHPQRVRDR